MRNRAIVIALFIGTACITGCDVQQGKINETEAIRLKPDDAEAYNNRGNAKFDLGDKQGAIADYNQAIRLKPDYALAYFNRGVAKYELGDRQGALNDFRQAAPLLQQQGKLYEYNKVLEAINLLGG